jgi:hypothetical protein
MFLLSKFIELNWQFITGISTTVIALCALVFSIWHGWQIRRHNKLSVRPNLTTWTNIYTGNGYYKLELVNNGIGPALIESFLIKVDDKLISGQGAESIENALKIIFPNLEYKPFYGYVSKGYSMVANERITIVEIQFLKQPFPTLKFMDDAINRTSLDIDYKSLYKELFHLHFPYTKR